MVSTRRMDGRRLEAEPSDFDIIKKEDAPLFGPLAIPKGFSHLKDGLCPGGLGETFHLGVGRDE